MNESQIFENALKFATPAERAAYLDEICGRNKQLRSEVEALLKAHASDPGFLEAPAISERATVDQAPLVEGPGTQVGPYRLLQEIGEGGMGVVFMAEQTHPMHRKVAVKVIKPGMDSRQVIARFEAERQALAMMDHVNIARVIDAGTTEAGRPFFVMELVHGVPITKYCDDNHLTPRERLELFVPVCQAIQHAHQKGIIHRDIKPSNVMITLHDGKPVPKVIDFGVAKAIEQKLTERTLFTQYGTMIGTFEYMSPEQAEMSGLGVDTRSDIYSLGVLLYELLTGSTPLSHKRVLEAGYAEILRMIKEEEPSKPSTRLSESGEALASISANRHMEPAKLTKLIRGELDWIVMKTLEKDRNRRYETATGLALDVQRYLADEPVLACPPSRGYRLRKFARKNRKLLVTAGTFVGLLVLSVIVSSWQWWRAQQKTTEALSNLRQARASVNEWLVSMSETTLLDAPGLHPLRAQLLEKTLKYYDSFLQQQSDDPEIRSELAAAYLRLAQMYISLGRNDEAVSTFQIANALIEKLLIERPNDARLFKPLAGYFKAPGREQQHRITEMPADPAKALANLQRQISIWERLATTYDFPGFQSDLAALYTLSCELLRPAGQNQLALTNYTKACAVLEKLIRQNPSDRSYQRGYLHSYDRLAFLLGNLNRGQEKEETLRRGVMFYEALATDFPTVPIVHMNLGIALGILADHLNGRKLTGEVEQTNRRAIQAFERASSALSHDPSYKRNLSNAYLGLVRSLASENFPEAEEFCRKALALRETLVADYPDVPDYNLALSDAYRTWAEQLQDKKQIEEAVQLLRKDLALREKLVAKFPTVPHYEDRLLPAYKKLATLLQISGQHQEVENLYQQAIARLEKFAAANPSAVQYRKALASARRELAEHVRGFKDRLGEAEKLHLQVLAEWNELAKEFPNDPVYLELPGHSYRYLGWIARDVGRHTDAIAYFDQGVAVFQKLAEKNSKKKAYYREFRADTLLQIGNTLWQLADLSSAAGRHDEAEKPLRRALDHFEKLAVDVPEQPQYRIEQAYSHWKLGWLLTNLGRHQETENHFRQALAIHEKLTADHPQNHAYRSRLADNSIYLAEALDRQGRQAEAAQERDKAIDEYMKVIDLNPDAYEKLVASLKTNGRHEELEKIYRQAIIRLEKMVGENPKESSSLQKLARQHQELAGLLLHQLNRPVEAAESRRRQVALWEKLVAESPSNDDYRLQLGNTLWQLADLSSAAGRHDETEKTLRRALDLFEKLAIDVPEQPHYRIEQAHTHWKLGWLLTNLGRHQETETHFRQALAIHEKLTADHPQNHDYRFRLAENSIYLAEALDRQDRQAEAAQERDKAFAQYAKVIELNPKDWHPWGRRAGAYFRQRQWDQAIADYSISIELNANVHGTWFHRGHAHMALQKWDMAIVDFSELLKRFPGDANAFSYRGWAYENLNQWDQAIADYTKAIELKPDQAVYWSNRGGACAALEQWENAAADFSKAVELKTDDAVASYRLALVGLKLGDLAGYHKACAGMLERFGQSPSLENAYWTIWTCALSPHSVSDWQPVVQLAEKTLAADPKSFDKLTASGAVLYRTGRFEEAAKHLTEAEAAFKETKAPRNSIIYTWLFLAMAHHRLDHAAEAEKWLKMAIDEMDRPTPDKTQAAPMAWNRRLTLQLLRREAEEWLTKESRVENRESEDKPN